MRIWGGNMNKKLMILFCISVYLFLGMSGYIYAEETDEVMLVTANGIVTRLKASSIAQQGRPATGVRAQNLVETDTVVSVDKIVNPAKDEESDENSVVQNSIEVTEIEEETVIEESKEE